jgi:hypothetical protein
VLLFIFPQARATRSIRIAVSAGMMSVVGDRNMIFYPPGPIRKRPPRERPSLVPTFALVSVHYEEGQYVRLTFNQPIDIAGFVPDQIAVSDDGTGLMYVGNVGTLASAETIEVELAVLEVSIDPGILLWASDGTGIVSINGQSWAGVSAMPIGT